MAATTQEILALALVALVVLIALRKTLKNRRNPAKSAGCTACSASGCQTKAKPTSVQVALPSPRP